MTKRYRRIGKDGEGINKLINLNEQVNENETMLQFIRNSEKEFGVAPALLQVMSDRDLSRYVDFLDDLWGK